MWIVFLILILLLLLTFCICTVMFWVFFTDKLIHIWRTGWTQIVRAWRQKTIPLPETWNIFFSAPLICCQRHQRAICILKNNVYRGCIVWSRSFSMTFSFLGKRTSLRMKPSLEDGELFMYQGNVRHRLSGHSIIRCLTHKELMDYLDVFFKLFFFSLLMWLNWM